MEEFKKKKMNTFWHSPLSLIVLFLIFIIFAYNMVGLFAKERETAKTKSLVLDKMNALQEREKSLTQSIDQLKTEKGSEILIRDKYQVVRPGEKMLVIVDKAELEVEENENKKEHGFLNWLKNLFK
ncbi:MAG: septum formation initiator family protein [Candidatus Pacebacteria bacterium]|nr:septum formation initiator family protein [Candidatus Paceibacterota bacterium]MBP9715791.1 septum formation initiator family protein [Candidatus Paceibacterota bacterium]